MWDIVSNQNDSSMAPLVSTVHLISNKTVKLESLSYDCERIGKLIITGKPQTHYFPFVLMYYYKLNGLFSYTVI